MEIIENQESLKSQEEKEFKALAKQIDLTRVYKDGNDNHLYMINGFLRGGSDISSFIMIDRYGAVNVYQDYQVYPADINPIPKFLKLLNKGIR